MLQLHNDHKFFQSEIYILFYRYLSNLPANGKQ